MRRDAQRVGFRFRRWSAARCDDSRQLGPLGWGDFYLNRLATAYDIEGDWLADFSRADFTADLLRCADRVALDGGNDVTGFEIGFGGGAVWHHSPHDDAVVRRLDQRAKLRLVPERAYLDAEPGASELAGGDDLVGNLVGQVAGDGEADAGMQAVDEGIDADDLAVDVDQRAATVARVDVGVRLDEV